MGHVNVPARVKGLLKRIGHIASARKMNASAVGGCVRDWWLGRATVDLDVAVEGDAVNVAHAVANAVGGTTTVHPQFGTATVRLTSVVPGLRIDFATCRRETYARPAAYPTVSAGTLEDDLFRRDFTINAMAVAISPQRFGELVDPFLGLEDLRGKRLRVLHERSFLDDPSRILRGIRFAQRFGLQWEPQTKRLLHEAVAAGALGWLNAGRLRKELDRLGQEPDPLAALLQLADFLKS